MNGKVLFALLAVMLLATTATAAKLTINQPDGTNDSTSDKFTIQWTPSTWETVQGIGDGNTISCYADADNSGYQIRYTAFVNRAMATADGNKIEISTATWDGRLRGRTYYIWCINDQNTDNNAYSSGPLTVTQFTAADIPFLGVDIAGGLFRGLAVNAYMLGLFVVFSIIMVLLYDVLTGSLGIIDALRRFMGGH